MLIHVVRAERDQALSLRRFAILVDVDVQMDAVLARLALGHTLEEETRFDSGGVGTKPPHHETPTAPRS